MKCKADVAYGGALDRDGELWREHLAEDSKDLEPRIGVEPTKLPYQALSINCPDLVKNNLP